MDEIEQGLVLAESIGEVELFDDLFAEVKVNPEGILEKGKRFDGTGPHQPYLDHALLSLLSMVPEDSPWADLRGRIRVLKLECKTLPTLNGFDGLEELHLELAKDLNLIHARSRQIEQVVLNLAVNARDAMPNGGELMIRTRNVTLDRAYVSEHDYVELNIVDNGCGMPADVARQVFDPFFTTKEVGKGTGLGLSTVYGIVKQLGGYIDLFSTPGEGTMFTMHFPKLDEVPIPAEGVDTSDGVLPVGSETVLVVEDEPEVRELLMIWLKETGYDVIEAAHGYEAIEMSQAYEGKINLLITDVVMPQMNGVEVAEELTRHRPDMKVLFISGFNEERIMQHGVAEADVHLLMKPIYRDSLAPKVREVRDMD